MRGKAQKGRSTASVWIMTGLVACVLAPPAAAGPAVGQFEVKTLDAEPGEIEFQSQNAYGFGVPRRRVVQDGNGDVEGDDNSQARARNALELEFGLTHFLKGRIGIEYEAERREEFTTLRQADGFDDLKLDEYAAELIVVAIPRHGDGFGLGAVVEYEVPAEKGGAQTLVAGPIFEWASGPWELTVIPTIVQFIGGERNAAGQRDEKMDFAYANRLIYHWSDHVDLALEAYGTVERIGGRGGRSEEASVFGDFDQHRLGPVVYWNFKPDWRSGAAGTDDDGEAGEVSLGIGALFGLNEATPDTTLKISMEYVF